MNKWPLLIFLAFTPVAIADDNKDRAAAIKIIEDIVSVCETKGMLACEKNVVGIDPMFQLLHLFEDLHNTEQTFNNFMQRRYADEGTARFYVLDASLRLSPNIQFQTKQFVQRIASVKRVANGFDVMLDGKDSLSIRKDSERWYMQFPEAKAREFERQFESFRLAAALKRSILIYHMLEADMAKLSRSDLERKVSEDLAPIVVALLGKEKFPGIVKWLVKDTKEVVAFYQQFETVDDMKAHIRKTYKLS